MSRKKSLQVVLSCFLLLVLLISSACVQKNQNANRTQEQEANQPIEQEPMKEELAEKDMIAKEPTLTDEQALLLIIEEVEDNIANEREGVEYTTRVPFSVVKISIPELYEKMQVVAYNAYSEEGNSAGTYLIHDGFVYPTFDSLENTCIADIDQNGTYELLSLFGFGSGIYRIHLNVYQCEVPFNVSMQMKILHLNYQNRFVPKNGYGLLAFHKISDTEVHLLDAETGQDYGSLVVAEDRHHIVPTDLENFPYYEWDVDYTFQSVQENQVYMEEIPMMKATVEDTSLHVVGWKKDWNGQEETAIPFSDLMEEDIPLFESPQELFGYDQEICLSFDGATPSSIKVLDSLLSKDGTQLYTMKEQLEREVRIGEDGNFYVGLTNHMALMLSSSLSTYENPSYRGFYVTCEFGEDQVCDYKFVLSLKPIYQ